MTEPAYRHDQIGRFCFILSPVLVIAAGIVWFLERDLVSVFALLLAELIIVLVLCGMRIEISGGFLAWRMGVGLVRKRVPVSEILSAEPVRNPWYYGWGIHHTFSGWLYNVSGFGGVEVTMNDGKRFRLGTDEPEELARAILKARSSPAAPPRAAR
jgi:hypothetical protein